MGIELPWDGKHELPAPKPSREEFLRSRERRYGSANPELIRDTFLEYMVKTGQEPYWLREEFEFEPDFGGQGEVKDSTAIWSYRRLGMSTTMYQDRFIISIGGEHDDYYDPDFLIYNDVIVRSTDGRVWIYAYPKADFPPIDFHTATLLDGFEKDIPWNLAGDILVIGGLGYAEGREFWRTPVYKLNLVDMVIQPVESAGEEPGWIHGHSSHLRNGGKVVVSGGSVMDEHGAFHPNTSEYEYSLTSHRWTKLT